MAKLKPCGCGNAVEVKYICGMDSTIASLSKNPFAGTMPAYYIVCDKCGKSMVVRLRMGTVTHRDKCKRDLIKAWNQREGGSDGALVQQLQARD